MTLAPAELYELVHRLLDAAHDIEINSAATLKRNQRNWSEA
ncbi:hypothetical protein [Limnohabitans sp.]|nr:hypothetical protein [Limnohabitans sp.]